MDQWQQSYPDAPGSSRRYNSNAPPSQPPMAREYNGNPQAQPPAGFTYEQYQGGMGAHAHSIAASPTATPNMRDGNGDVAMLDPGDSYNSIKYPMRPHHQQHLSGSRIPSLHSTQEPSTAAQRYSPMETLSPSSPYGASQQGQNQYGSRQSPTRPGNYSSPTSLSSGTTPSLPAGQSHKTRRALQEEDLFLNSRRFGPCQIYSPKSTPSQPSEERIPKAVSSV